METWTVSEDQTTATVTGREKISILKKINPFWWFGNDAEQNLDQAPWYMPDKPQWQRQLYWEFRNPLQNLRSFVLGVQDCNYTVTGKAPVMTVQRNDLDPPQTGYQTCTLHLKVPRPFISYCGTKIVWYLGWQPTGFFGAKLNFH